MKLSSFQKVGMSIALFCVLFVITASGLTATRGEALGEWDIKIKFNGREITSTLKIIQQEDGSYTGKWESRRGESTVTDVIFKDGKLSFKRKSKYGDQEWESTFTGTVEGNKLTGKIKSERGEIEANGKRLMPSVFGKWELATETRRGGALKRVLTLKEDMTGTYQMRGREVPIKELKIEEQEITFKLEMRVEGRSFTRDFRGKFEGDIINGEFTTPIGKRDVKGKRIGTETAGITAEEAIDRLDKMIETAKQTGKVENIDEAVATIEAAGENMETADLLEKLDVLQKHRKDSALPKPEKALSSNQKLDWAILTRQILGQEDLPVDKVKAHPAAKAFPGAVDIKAKRVKKAVEIRTDRPGWRNKGTYAASWKKEWQSTGLYAAPGEVIAVTVAEEARDAGLSIRIGAHSDRLWRHDKWRRAPEICRSFEIKDAVTKAANAFGGPIYIETPHDCALGKFNVTIDGAVEMPWYVAGKTTSDEWKEIRDNPAPWAELQTAKLVLTLPTEHVVGMDDPAELMEFWDGVMDSCADLLGKGHDRKRAERFVTDTQISVGSMHAGYPLMAGRDIGSTLVDKIRIMRNGQGVWGVFHEIGHNHQNSSWVYRGTTEVTVNLFSLYVFEKMCGLKPKDNIIHRGVLPANRERSLKKYLEGGKKFENWQGDPFLALYMYSMMQEDFGWEPFTKVFKEYRAADESELPKNDDDKRDQWMVRFSRMVGKNLGPFFDAWGVPTSQEAKKSISSLSAWMPTDFPETIEITGPVKDCFDPGESILLEAKATAYEGGKVRTVEFIADGKTIASDTDAPYVFNWAGAEEGRHTIKAKIYDSKGRTKESLPVTIFVGMRALERSVTHSIDDAEEFADGSMHLKSTDLELINDSQRSERGDQVVGMRFTDIPIPQGAQIKKAYVQFTVDEVRTKATNLVIHAETTPYYRPRFMKVMHNISSRKRTKASVKWSPEPWNVIGERSEKQRTPDLSAIIQEVIAQSDWQEGNALVFIITGSGERCAVSYDGDQQNAPVLYIEY